MKENFANVQLVDFWTSCFTCYRQWIRANKIKIKADTPDLSIIRGAISTAAQCVRAGGVINLAEAKAFSSAAIRAENIIKNCTVDAIVHACETIHEIVK